MQQVELYVKGQKDYAYLEGGTGPLVYPGLHVYIYRALYALTDHGKNIFVGQILFAGLYLGTLAVVMACYSKAKVNRASGCNIETNRIGSSICLPNVDTIQKTSQYIHAETIQRLLYGIVFVSGNLLLPKSIMESWYYLFHLRPRSQDEPITHCAWSGFCYSPGSRP
jgi:hypothetical protein